MMLGLAKEPAAATAQSRQGSLLQGLRMKDMDAKTRGFGYF
jgi:hypothetical protein